MKVRTPGAQLGLSHKEKEEKVRKIGEGGKIGERKR